jgi:hypothetical protein
MSFGIGLGLSIPGDMFSGAVSSEIVLAFITRVIADGGRVESTQCIDEKLKYKYGFTKYGNDSKWI